MAMTDQQREFLSDLCQLLIKHNAEIEVFEDEIYISFSDGSGICMDSWHVTKEALEYHLQFK